MEKFTYLSGENIGYVEELFERFLSNPDAVDPEWRMFFEGIEFAKKIGGAGGAFSQKEIKVYDLIRAYRNYGHYKATLDPLTYSSKSIHELELKAYDLVEADLNTTFEVGALIGLPKAKLKDIVTHLERVYCGTLAADFADTPPEVKAWVIEKFERENLQFKLPAESKKALFRDLVKTEALEKFIHTRFVGQKRFSVEGADSLIPMLEHLVSLGSREGMQELVLGMAHRGRVNVLGNFMRKPLDLIFAEFDGGFDRNQGYVADGDVKYHMGFSVDKETTHGSVHVSLAFNPSHLEAVDPVVCGMARAKQRIRKDNKERKRVVPVLVHGDAAFIGQGVVAETFQLSQLEGYSVGGTIHIVTNNQVGFTTSPDYARSSRYCTDVAKALAIPVFHVNGDDAEACVRAMQLAYEFRQKFSRDVVIDVVCYRRYGHNEGDEPAFTQPVMYNLIKKHPVVREIYGRKLVGESLLAEADINSSLEQEMNRIEEFLQKARKENTTPKFFTLAGVWKGLKRGTLQDMLAPVNTAATVEHLRRASDVLTSYPNGFQPHAKLQKLLDGRKKMMEDGMLDWGMAELLSYGTLILEGTPVRISGQDVGRGTFTHRHAVFHDANNGSRYVPLNSIHPDVADFAIHDSFLSEMAVLGFEYGNSTTDPRALSIWEAQFGDFANGAQIIIDQFLSSAESKWQRMSGLVLLLPHGYEGQGPEHSSARLERFLQLCAQENMQVANVTTPAQIFHILRRQVKRDFRKPLVIMSPKSLLRHPKAVSPLSELSEGKFQEVLSDSGVEDPFAVRRAIICSGKLYYELEKEREDNVKDGTAAIIRAEQLYPFPAAAIAKELAKYPNLKQIIWAQEEPKNMGAYFYVAPRLQEACAEFVSKGVAFRYVGRTERASPAIGSPKRHAEEQAEIVKGCFR